jgi:hypothetical protein
MSLAPRAVVEAVTVLPNLPAVLEAVRSAALSAARARRTEIVVQVPGLDVQNASTSFGNVADALARGPSAPGEAALAGALLALALRDPSVQAASTAELARELLWLSAHTPYDALAFLDAALGDDAAPYWDAVAAIADESESRASGLRRGERLAAMAALAASPSPVAASAVARLQGTTMDPLVREPLRASDRASAVTLSGELGPTPRGPIGTALFALTGIAFVRGLARVVLRAALAYRRPAHLKLTGRGLEIAQRTELLGRVLRDRETVVPLANLASVSREVRYARVGVYAGLLALVLGTYVGIGFLVDGARVPGGSPSLLGMGLLAIAAGVVLDFVFAVVVDVVRKTCRVVVTPQHGPRLCIQGLDPEAADRALAELASKSPAESEVTEPTSA